MESSVMISPEWSVVGDSMAQCLKWQTEAGQIPDGGTLIGQVGARRGVGAGMDRFAGGGGGNATGLRWEISHHGLARASVPSSPF